MSKASQNVLRGIRQDPAAVALAKEVEALEAANSELKVRDSNVTFHSRNVMAVNQDLAQKLAEAERKLAGLKAYAEKLRVWLENDEPGFDLIDELWAVVNILDGKGE